MSLVERLIRRLTHNCRQLVEVNSWKGIQNNEITGAMMAQKTRVFLEYPLVNEHICLMMRLDKLKDCLTTVGFFGLLGLG